MIQVAVGMIEQNGLVLVCQRKKGSRYELKWEFPGGKVEKGETPLHCLKRELREELGITVKSVKKSIRHDAKYADGRVYKVTYFFVKSFAGELRNQAFEQIQWVTRKELASMETLEGNIPFVKMLTHE